MVVLHLLLLAAISSRSAGEEVCYPPCGCVNNDDPPFEDTDLPQSPEAQELRYELYTTSNPDNPLPISWDNVPSQFNPSKKTVFVIHGWLGRTTLGDYPIVMKDAFLDNGKDYNIIIVDWDEGANDIWYPQSAMNTRVVGMCTGHLADSLAQRGLEYSNMHCVGTSLGAQACGFTGKKTNGRLGRATGLDPAGPSFMVEDPRGRLDRTDAVFVDSIHSNGNNDFINLGSGAPNSDVDFYPNKAGPQPPCDDFSCDHGIGTLYFQISLNNTQCQFSSYPCQSDEDADANRCETCQAGFDCQRMGYYADSMPGRGRFFLRTVEDYPYCRE